MAFEVQLKSLEAKTNLQVVYHGAIGSLEKIGHFASIFVKN